MTLIPELWTQRSWRTGETLRRQPRLRPACTLEARHENRSPSGSEGGAWGRRRSPAHLSRQRRGAAAPGHGRRHTGGPPSLLVARVTRLFSRRFRRRALRLLISST